MVIGFEGILPIFGRIEHVLVIEQKALLIIHITTSAGMCEHFQSYVLDSTCTYSPHCLAFFLSDLVDYYPLHAHTSFSQTDCHLYVTLKWNIENIHERSVVE